MASEVHGGAPGQGHYASLRCRVVRLTFLRSPSQHRRVIDHDAAVALRDHLPQGGSGAAERAVQGDIQDAAPVRISHVQHRAGAAETRIIDHHVDMAEVIRCPVYQRIDGRTVSYIAWHGPDPVAVLSFQFGSECLQTTDVLVTDRDMSPLSQASLRGCRP